MPIEPPPAASPGVSHDFAMLQSVARLLETVAATERDALQRFACLRAAHVVTRLALAVDGLDALNADAVDRLRALNRSLGMDSDVGHSESGYRHAMAMLDDRLRRDSGDPRWDAALQELACIDFDRTKNIAFAADQRRNAWRAGRPDSARLVTAEMLSSYFRQHFPDHPDLIARDVTRLGGINANEAYFCTIAGHPDWPTDIVLRRMLPAQIQPRSITEEFDVLEAMGATGMPVPRPLFRDDHPPLLGQPIIAVERLPGITCTLTDMGDEGRAIFRQLAALMGQLHRLDPALLPVVRRAADGDALQWLLDRITRWEQDWLNATYEPVATVTHAFHWLRRHASRFCALQSVVHGDLDQRNLLCDAGRIVALIDWEVAHQGHPAEDLAYVRPQVEALMPWSDFLAIYQQHGGIAPDAFEMRYGAVLCNMLRVTTSMAAQTAYDAGQIDNFLMGSVRTIETEQACQALHQAIMHKGSAP